MNRRAFLRLLVTPTLRRCLGGLLLVLLCGAPAQAALELAAGTTDQILFGDIDAFDGVGSLTYMFWYMRVGNANLTVNAPDIQKTNGNNNFIFYHSSSVECAPNCISMGTSGVWECRVPTVNPLTANTWVHIAFVWNGTVWRIHINGAQAATSGVCGTAFSNALDGVLIQDNTGTNYRIATLKVWSVALTSPEVMAEAQIIRPQRTDNLLLWAPFDDGTSARDYSGHDRHGTTTGTAQRDSPPASWGGD